MPPLAVSSTSDLRVLPSPLPFRSESNVLPTFDDYLRRWCLAVADPNASEIIHFAYRLHDRPITDGWDSPVDLLIQAASRSKVTVVLSPHGGRLVNLRAALRLRRFGVEVIWAPTPMLGSMHIKGTFVDSSHGCTFLTGSMDLHPRRNTAAVPRRGCPSTHELGLAFSGPIAEQAGHLVRDVVLRFKSKALGISRAPALRAVSQLEWIAIGGPLADATGQTESLESLLCDAVRGATDSIWIEDQFIALTHPGGSWTSPVLGELCNALARGVNVTVVSSSLPWSSGVRSIMGIATTATLRKLSAAQTGTGRFQVFERRQLREPVVNHSKILLVDKRQLITGSSNLCRRSFGLDHELLVSTREPTVVTSTAEHLQSNCGQTQLSIRPLDVADGPRPSWARRRILNRLVDPPSPRVSRLAGRRKPLEAKPELAEELELASYLELAQDNRKLDLNSGS